MDGLAEFSILALFGALATHSPISNDRSLVSIIKFCVTLPAAILATILIWALIARVGSMTYIPTSLGLAIGLTLSGVFATFVIMLFLVSHGMDYLEKQIRNALKERHIKHDMNNTHKLIHLNR